MTPEINYESVFDVPAYKRMSSAEKVKTQFIEELHKISGKSFDQLNSQEKKLVEDAKNFAELLEERSRRINLYKKQSIELRNALAQYVEVKNEIKTEAANLTDIVKGEIDGRNESVPVIDKGRPYTALNSVVSQIKNTKEEKGGHLVEKKTNEEVTNIETNFFRKSQNRFDTVQGLSSGSKHSLNQILKRSDLRDVFQKLEGLVPDRGVFKMAWPVTNYREFGSELKKAGYISTGILDDKEAAAIYYTISDYISTQDRMSGLSEQEKIQILFDDGDGLLQASNGEVSNLFQSTKALHLKGGDGFDALVENLGMNKNDLFNEMSVNLFSTRERFVRALSSAEASGYNITELSKKGKLAEVSRNIIEKESQYEQVITTEVQAFMTEKGLISQGKYKKGAKELEKDLIDSIRLQALSASYVDGQVGVGTSVDIQDFTKGILDSISVGVSEDGKIGLSVNKGLFTEKLAKYGTSVVVGIGNTLSPYMAASQKLGETDISDSDKFLTASTDTGYRTSTFATISSGMKMLGVNIAKNTLEASERIEEESEKMSEKLQEVGESIQKGLDAHPGLTPEEGKTYKQMKQAFENATYGMSLEEKNQYMKIFLDGYVNYFRNDLYKKAEGTKFTNISLGVLSISGFYNLPFITVGGEKISTKQNEVIKDGQRQIDITQRRMDISQLGGKIEEIDGKKVFSLPTTFNATDSYLGGELQISVPDNSPAQIKIQGNKIYVGGVDGSDLSIIETTYGGKYYRTLVVGEGVKGENNLYLNSFHQVDKITSGIGEGVGAKEVLQGIEVSQKIENISKTFSQIISTDALLHKNTPGMMALQRDFFNFRRGESQKNIDQIWSQYITMLSDKRFLSYATQGGKMDGINFLTFLGENKQITSNADKIYILQALAMALTSKGKLVFDGDKYGVDGGNKTIDQYNKEHKRDQYFDTMMRKEIPSLAGSITQARNKWNERFGGLKSYSRFTRRKGLALSGSQVGRGTGLTPLSDGYDLIGSEETGLIPMNVSEKQKNDLINRIPTYILEGYKNQLNSLGFDFRDINQVKDFIRNGGNESFKVDMDVFFGKNAQCINDAIVFDISVTPNITTQINVGAQSSSFIQENKTIQLGVMVAGKLTEKKEKNNLEEPDDEKPKDPETEPDQEVDPEPNPGEPIGPDPVEPPVKPDPVEPPVKPEPKPDPKPVTPGSTPNQEVRPAPDNVVEVPITQPDSPVVNMPSSTPTTSSTNSGRGR